jgi:transposase
MRGQRAELGSAGDDLATRRDADLSSTGCTWFLAVFSVIIRRRLRGFSRSLHRDWQAVYAGFTVHWSSGPVEGNINRLKLIKRQMYGRGGFDLLRKRVLLAS